MPDLTHLHDDRFEAELSERLHDRALPPEVPGLEQASVRRGGQLRRRRRVGLTALVVAVLVGVALGGNRLPLTFGPDIAPVAPAATPAPAVDGSLAHPEALPLGDAPPVDYVADSLWYRSDGSALPLQGADRSDGAVSWVHNGDHLFVGRVGEYSIDGGPYRALPDPTEESLPVAGVPGPDGSVLVESNVLSIFDRDGRWRVNEEYGAYRGKFTLPHPARSSVWSVDPGEDGPVVVRRASLKPGASTTTFSAWQSITTSDPRSDQVVLRDGTSLSDADACNAIVNGTTGRTGWQSCSWSFLRLSSDGHYALARAKTGLAVLDLTTRAVVYELGTNDDVSAESYRFADDNTLTAVVRSASEGFAEAIVSCDLSGLCWRSTTWATDFHYALVTGDR